MYIFICGDKAHTCVYFNSGSNDLSNKIFAMLFPNICWIMTTKERQSVFEIMLFGMKLSLRVQWQILLKWLRIVQLKKKPGSSQQKQSESRKTNLKHLHVIPKDKILIMTFCTLSWNNYMYISDDNASTCSCQ